MVVVWARLSLGLAYTQLRLSLLLAYRVVNDDISGQPTKPWLRTMRLVGPRLLAISWMLWLEVFKGLEQSLRASLTLHLAAGLCPGKPLLRMRRLWKLVRAPLLQAPAPGKPKLIFQEICLEMFLF